ncbi:TonB-dependent receptor domain-containing protein [Brevundimonas sp. FT23042]|uniref:TonB-dependent receptor domain-containing protein n=1 Tax=Brevundimonas sp. FT23042 TaxID=3393749 RepID=UPI003B588E01
MTAGRKETGETMTSGFTSTALAALLAVSATPVLAQANDETRQFNIEAGPLSRSLPRFAEQSGQQILYPTDLVAGRSAAALSGAYRVEDALALLLRNTGLTYRRSRPNVFVLVDPTARAQDSAGPATLLEEVVVTGSHLRGAESPSPVVVLTQADIDRQGRSTVADTLAALPQNFAGSANEGSAGNGTDRAGTNIGFSTGVNLRGLGADATLVLINGRRIAGSGNAGDFADISNIPSSAVARADVLLDGASALYGADAVGGVVNIILKSRFDGAETRVRYGGTSDGGAQEVLFSQTAGFNWASGSLIAAYEYHDRSELAADDRRATTSADLRPLGGSDWRLFYAAPGNIMFYNPANGSFNPVYAIPRGQDGTGLSPGDFLAGEVNLTNQNQDIWMLPHQRRHSVFLAARQALPGNFSLDGDLRYTERNYTLQTPADIGTLVVTPANPYFVSPDGVTPQEIAYSWINDLGPGISEGRTRAVSGAFGIEGEIAGWSVSAYASGAQDITGRSLLNRVQTTNLSEALGSRADNPATPFNTATDGFFNPYGDPAANSAAMLAFIGSGYSSTDYTSTVASLNFKVDGALLQLPGGPLQMALGLDARRERFENEGESFFSGSAPRMGAPVDYERDVTAAFVEFRVPIIGQDNAMPGLERLELSAAVRTERHGGVGDTTNPKIGLLYSPTSDLRLRASYGTSFRAPSLRELYSPFTIGPTYLARADANLLSLVLYGGNPDLRPETAESVTAGFVWTPQSLNGFRLEGGWFRTRFDDRIANPVRENLRNALTDPTLAPFVQYVNPATNAEDRTFVQSLLDDPGNYNPNVFPATAYSAVVDNRNVNASRLEVEGLDVSVRYGFDMPVGRMNLDGAVTHLLAYNRQITESSPLESMLGDPSYPSRWRGRAGGQWIHGALTLGLAVNYVSGGRDPIGGQRVDDWTTFDGQVRYDLADDLSITLNMLNLANTEAPFYDAPAGFGYDAANTNILGRQVSLQLVKRW